MAGPSPLPLSPNDVAAVVVVEVIAGSKHIEQYPLFLLIQMS